MIGMYDSGLGGLSIWQAVTTRLPEWPILYLADQAYCPYGRLTQHDIARRTVSVGHYLVSQGATLLVVACNTATSNAIHTLRRTIHVPVVGVEPAIKPAAAATKSGRISVIATPATLTSEGFRSLVQRFATNIDVLPRAGIGWVEQVERGDLTSPYTREIVSRVITPLLTEHVDQIVLGCTHYPFLLPLINEIVKTHITLTNPAVAIAHRVAHLLKNQYPAISFNRYHFLTTSYCATTMSTLLPALIGRAYPVKTVSI